MDFLTGWWGFFITNLASYWIGAMFFRAIYRQRIKNLVENQRAVMDTLIDEVEHPESILPFCSDALVRGVYTQAQANTPLFRVAEAVMQRRGLTLPPPGPPMRMPAEKEM